MTKIKVVRGSLLDQNVECIVNAANPGMRGGGGIDGLIHAAAGDDMSLELEKLTPNGADFAEPVLTGGHNLKQEYIIHVAGPIWRGGEFDEERTLRNCYLNSLRLAGDNEIKSIGFCSISTGIFGFPLDKAAKIAAEVVCEFEEEDHYVTEIVFAMFGEKEYEVFKEAFKDIVTE